MHVLKHGTKFSVSSIEEGRGIGPIAELAMIGGSLPSGADERTDLRPVADFHLATGNGIFGNKLHCSDFCGQD